MADAPEQNSTPEAGYSVPAPAPASAPQAAKQANPYLIPGAIVFAGALIAAGAYLGMSSAAPAGAEKPLSRGEYLISIADDIGLKEKDFKACLSSGKFDDKLDAQVAEAVKAGGTGTPFTIVVNERGERFPFSGALPYDYIKQIVDQALAGGEFQNDKSEAAASMPAVSDSDHFRGSRDAKVVFVEYSDYDCPFCSRLHPTLKRLVDEYDGRVAWVYRHFPLTQLHPQARDVSIAAECAAELGGNDAFWEFTDRYFEV
jgi:protein-disulfide isomerase